MSVAADDLLVHGEMTVLGRIMPASNSTFFCRLGPEETGVRAVYKPVSGERPLWDFADGTLAAREYAAWLVSEALGWSVVPPTVLREGSAGPGMVQLWCEPDPTQAPVDLLPEGPLPEGQLHVLDAFDERDRPVMLVHENTVALRRMTLFDVVVNNTDRKGGHVLIDPEGRLWLIDHGICFHAVPKLRTVIWDFAGQAIADEECAHIMDFLQQLAPESALIKQLAEHLLPYEIRALRDRTGQLLSEARFPLPIDNRRSYPWPPV